MSDEQINSDSVVRTVQNGLAVIIGLSVLATALYAAFFGAPITYVYRPIFLFAIVAVAIFLYPSGIFSKDSTSEFIFNVLCVGTSAAATLYFVSYWVDLQWESYLNNTGRVLAALLILSVVEAARRTTARPLIFVAAAFLIYAIYGSYFPGILQHTGVTWENALRVTVLGTDGIFGAPIGFAAGFVTLFVFFTALMNVSGAGTYLLNIAYAMAGRSRGGPGKVALIGSGMMGMVSGSGVTNVLTTGTITIPMMKRAGYSPAYAAGIEAVASQGSQFVPPIMGAAVFLMAEYTGVPFLTLAAYCLVPAFLYYLSVFTQVHFRACREDIRPEDAEKIPKLKDNALKSLMVFIPIGLLVALLFLNYSTDFAIAVTFLSLVLTTMATSETRIFHYRQLAQIGFEGIRTLASIAAALALAGMVVGMILLTGLGARLTTLISVMADGSLLIALVMTSIVAILLGMGVVTVGAYVIVASLTAPILTSFGLPLEIAHLFIFYYATLSGLTPPVAVVIFAAAGIAEAPAMRTAWYAMRLGFVAWLVPFIFAYYPSLIGYGGITLPGILNMISATFGVIAVGAAFEGWALHRAGVAERLLFFAGGVCLMFPSFVLVPVGLTFLGVAIFLNKRHGTDHGLPASNGNRSEEHG
ncbi:TRAP transporter fused permease subunit [Aurantimonas sp. C2-5-R2]|uniref:TRAP transporter permease n=1 Tax=Aurantimonas sp. C2-5-R2 TaxID=3113713 RepID=UPI002F929DEC